MQIAGWIVLGFLVGLLLGFRLGELAMKFFFEAMFERMDVSSLQDMLNVGEQLAKEKGWWKGAWKRHVS